MTVNTGSTILLGKSFHMFTTRSLKKDERTLLICVTRSCNVPRHVTARYTLRSSFYYYYKHAFIFGTAQGSNPGPFDPKSDTLTLTL